MFRIALCSTLLAAAAALFACGSGEEAPPAKPAPEVPPAAVAPPPPPPADLPRGIALALAQFRTVDGKPVPGAARLEFLYRKGGAWHMSSWEDEESNVFHKAMLYESAQGPRILSLGGTAAIVKTWTRSGETLEGTTHWREDFGGRFSRMRDAEVADLYGDGGASIAVATHDQGVVAVLRPQAAGGFEKIELDRQTDIFVHEIEIGDLDGDGVLEVYATPSEPNRLEGEEAQAGDVVRYVPATGAERAVVAALGDRHAKEILVEDVDGDGRDELYVSVEGSMGADKRLANSVEIRRFEAETAPDAGAVIATLKDRLSRFITVGDVEGDGRKEMVVATFSSGVWLLRPGGDPNGAWKTELIDRDSKGFEHAAILTDLDGDGRDELYVASDHHKQVRRYVWDGARPKREVIYRRPDARPIFTWNLMPLPISLIPGA